jgi:DNA (cytosine-5)-methyltransferase 1
MRYLSVCSGIEAATVAWHPLGWQPVAFSEIEPFPSAVLAHHYPSVPNLGDMTKFQEWPDESIDLLVGGTPCQSFSVAGLRKGLEDPRGNLMLTYLAIAQRYRPRWLVWENVPGVLSSNGGRDFGTFLGALGELGYGWAYRVLDAQWFGVAQRRRRVFVVGHLGEGQRAAQVLFERESVQRNPAPSRETGQSVAASVGGGVNERGTGVAPHIFKVRGGVEREDGSRGSTNIGKQAGKGYLGSEERAFTLAAAQDQFVAQPVAFHANAQACQLPGPDRDTSISDSLTRSQQAAVAQPVAMRESGQGYWMQASISDTMRSDSNQSGKEGTVVAQPVAFRKSRRAQSVDDHETWVEDGIANTLNCHDVGDIRAVDVVAQPVAYGIDGEQNASKELIGTLRSHQSGGYEGARVAQPVAFQPGNLARGAGSTPSEQVFPTLKSDHGRGASDQQPHVMTAMQVRRLTPVECERLQGFPDNYTNIPWRKKPEAPDGPRYKALGNSMAVPCMAWIGQRIAEVDRGD